jgi:hypothetical protein
MFAGCEIFGKRAKQKWRKLFMMTKETNVPLSTTTVPQHRFNIALSGLAVRLLVAFLISWLIILAFFISGVVSH